MKGAEPLLRDRRIQIEALPGSVFNSDASTEPFVARMKMWRVMIFEEHAYRNSEEISNLSAPSLRIIIACNPDGGHYRAEHGFAFEHLSPITAMPWISISMPGTAKFDTVMSALPG